MPPRPRSPSAFVAALGPAGTFRPCAFYHQAVDLLEIHLESDPYLIDRVDDDVALLLTPGARGRRVVGLLLKQYGKRPAVGAAPLGDLVRAWKAARHVGARETLEPVLDVHGSTEIAVWG